MKKTTVIISSLMLVLSMVSCSNNAAPSGSGENPGGDNPPEQHVHSFKDIAAVEPTCQKTGNIAYSVCETCGKYFDAQHENEIAAKSYILDKLPHDLTYHEGVLFETYDYWSCSMCGKQFYDKNGTAEVTSLDAHDEHELLNENVKAYLMAETEKDQIEALENDRPFNDQVQKTLTWPLKSASYTVELSEDVNFSSYRTYTTTKNSLTLPGILTPGTKYYWRVKDSSGDIVINTRGFETNGDYVVRTIAVDGVYNMRDVGGWTAKDGNKVQYGLLYRGARLTNITKAGKNTFLDELGIKTEIDLRADGVKELNDVRLDYNKCGFDQYTIIVPNYSSPKIEGKPTETHYGFNGNIPASLKEIFRILAEPYNYPVYFHCNAGADRTGTLAYLLNGLLGVSYEDLVKDFELTTFSAYGPRLRSLVKNGKFVTEGDYAGIYECDTDNYIAFGKLHELISTNYAQPNGELCSAIEMYLKKVCDIDNDTIQAVRRNLLGKDVEFDEVEIKEDTTLTIENGNLSLSAGVAHERGKFFGDEEVSKFYTTDSTNDHYIYNNLNMITNEKYTNYHFEVYVPSNCAKWYTHQGKDSGAQFHLSIKTSATTNIQFSSALSTSSPGVYYALPLDEWVSYDFDISNFDETLQRFALYLAYGTTEIPGVIYLRNVYVS